MRTGVLLVLISAALSAQSRPQAVDFESDRPGQLLGGWTFALTGSGRPGKWIVKKDEPAADRGNVLAQADDDRTSYRFPLAIFDDVLLKDGDLGVRFKPVSGRVDQGAGLVWRYRDQNNYYVARANALEGNVVLYKVQNGRRTDLPVKGAGRTYGQKTDVPKARWSQLVVTVSGHLFTVTLNGRKLFDVEDTTFPDAGKTGLWTKADSVIYFDDFTVSAR